MTSRGGRLLASMVVGVVGAHLAAAQVPEQRNPMDSIRALPGYRPAADTAPLITPAKIAALPAARRADWTRYLARSARVRAADSAAMQAELRAAGLTSMRRAPYGKGFAVTDAMTPAWFAGDSARWLGERIVSFQAPNGGWSKHVDYAPHARQPGESYFGESDEWTWISTIDNGSTTSQLRYLVALDRTQPAARWRRAVVAGLEYLLAAQFPNGCWPQVYPLQGSYHDALTFNDDATIASATLLRDVGNGAVRFVPATLRRRAAAAARRTVDCLLETQYRDRGRLTVWGQQHDPLALLPVSARSYEHASLVSQESAAILRYLMEAPKPSARVVRAVHAGAAWLQARALHGLRYDFATGMHPEPGAGPVWARMYEIGTNRPLFSNRDGIRRYDWNELTDRRLGYGWYSYAPIPVLAQYERWRRAHPESASHRTTE